MYCHQSKPINDSFETNPDPKKGLDPGSTETVSRHSTTLVSLNNSFYFRRTLKNRILQYDPDQFGTPLPHTSRTKRPEEDNGMRYWFVDREVRQ